MSAPRQLMLDTLEAVENYLIFHVLTAMTGQDDPTAKARRAEARAHMVDAIITVVERSNQP